ncbi:O-antigen/teichoic acid export membrane protein [Mucilaginibacter gracilis]|uniref:O-antigen/teichoic acid export membrane protein n=1 Tax=Mucilaginibacter gracilis TaxID=423350 RepID=A0A495IXQ3_9SPHI|nr:polysaccharide biosynthesis C-terminal domain-containing protein [Mucilaginibacter gracilis]RKR80848.1 O-antigen/teichoic acid export membrane protein [Mucilaginibacter gracilis]
MGIIQQQTIKGTIYSYLGVLIGVISINVLQPHALTTEQVGLTGMLLTSSALFAKFATLGFSGTSRYFPYFRDNEAKHNGYLFLYSAVSFVGILIFIGIAYYFKDDIISAKSQKGTLFNQYYWYLIPLIIFSVYFDVFDLYARVLYNAISGRILREFTKRLFILMAILLVYFKFISFGVFMVLWLLANIVPTVILAGRLVINKEFFFSPNLKFLDKDMRRKLTSISLLGILTGSSPLIVDNIDKYVINQKFGLGETGVYTIAVYFATVIALPARSLYSIATTVISESFKSGDFKNIKMVYEKSCINQLIASLFLLVAIWANVNNIFSFLPASYLTGKYVVLYIGIGYLIDSATGINGVILNASKYYKYDGYFYLLLIGVTVGGNLLLIPLLGIAGAAVAAGISLLSFNLFRYIFIYKVFKMQPFTIKNLYALFVGIAVYFLSVYLIPQGKNYIIDSIIRTSFITLLYWTIIYYLKVSDDINLLLRGYIIKLKNKA